MNAHNTSVSWLAFGEWRIDPDHRQDRRNGPITTFKLSPEELKKYSPETYKKPSMAGIETMIRKDCEEDMKTGLRERVRELLNQNKSLEEIAAETNYSEKFLKTFISRYKLKAESTGQGVNSITPTVLLRAGDYIGTYTGRQYWPLDPNPEEVCIEDIAHALSQICRFTGHTNKFYSVAEHCLNVEFLLRESGSTLVRLYGLLHDAAEAYVCDMVRPLNEYCQFDKKQVGA